MAVYTQLEFDELETLLAPLKLGRLIAAKGAAAGVENTTYFLEFAGGPDNEAPPEYVLTISETLTTKNLEFVARLMHELNRRGLPVPDPVFADNRVVLSIRGKPAMLVPRIAGTHVASASPDLCHQLGQTLAKLHLATLALGYRHDSHRSLTWVTATGKTLLEQVSGSDRTLLVSEMENLSEFVSTNTNLPQAVIHGDLFRDNVLVQHGAITGIIDFFSAGTGYLLFDLAVVVNDWCFDSEGELRSDNYKALIGAYCGIRQPDAIESERWGELLRIAALRFWVSRLSERLLAGAYTPRGRGKNPAPYRRLILQHRGSPLRLSD